MDYNHAHKVLLTPQKKLILNPSAPKKIPHANTLEKAYSLRVCFIGGGIGWMENN